MAGKSRFTRLDAFTKTVEDARIRTTSGGIVTITSLIVIFWLVWGEWADYRRVVVRPELVVDKGRGTFLCSEIPRWGRGGIPEGVLVMENMMRSGEDQLGRKRGGAE
jgi:hypothetical protein